ncbi:hypothetical protein ACE1CD_21180 [Aerosakkonema sp. BLCC-F183]
MSRSANASKEGLFNLIGIARWGGNRGFKKEFPAWLEPPRAIILGIKLFEEHLWQPNSRISSSAPLCQLCQNAIAGAVKNTVPLGSRYIFPYWLAASRASRAYTQSSCGNNCILI